MVDFELKITKVNDISRYSTADRLTQLVERRTDRAGGLGFEPRPDQHSGS